MPVCVHIPIRLRTDSEALDARCGCIDDALRKAAGRALANSRDVVLAARGGYVGTRLHAPEFIWTGDGLPQIPAARRAELERRWTQTLLRTASRAALATYADEAERAPDPLPPDPWERFDRLRWNAAATAYDLPSYDGQAMPKPVGKQTRPPAVRALPKETWGFSWRAVRTFEEFEIAFYNALGARDRSEVNAEYFGALYLNGLDGAFTLTAYHGDLYHPLWDGPLSLTTYKFENGTWHEQEPDLPPDAIYSMEFLGDGTDENARLAIYRNEFADDIRSSLLQQGGEPATDEQVEAEVKRRAGKYVQPKLFKFHVNAWEAILAMPAALPSHSFEVIPVSEWDEISDTRDDGKGGGARTGGGKGAPKGGGKEGKAGEGKTGVVEGEEEREADTVFPTYQHQGETLACEAFEGEPSLTALGADGERLRPAVELLARHLDIDPCDYAGAFCLIAAKVIAQRADDIATYAVGNEAGELKPARSGGGNLGLVNFKPVPSPAIQLLRHLGAAAPLISGLTSLIWEVYDTRENAAKIEGYRNGNYAGWALDFHVELLAAMGHSVGYVFAMTCRVLLLQLLRASWTGIREREWNFDGYAARFEQLIQSQITDLDQLKLMLDQLKPFAPKSAGDLAGTLILGTWREARHEVISMFELQSPSSGPTIRAGGTLEWKGGSVGIRDPKGYLWSRDELETAIALRTSIAEAIDPLVIQIDADPELAARFRNHPGDIKGELKRLLSEMEMNNAAKTGETERDAFFAFQASKIYEADTRFSGTSRTGYNLTGIHQLAHEAIEDAFRGSDFYRYGVKYLFDVEMGKRGLVSFFEFTGVLLLCVLCAPLGVAVGGALAVYHEHEALEEQRLFKSLLNPELVITRAEVEIDLFVGELGVALAFIPEVGTILKGATKAGSALIKGELIAVTRAFAIRAAKEIAKEVIKNLEKGLLEAFIKEFVKAEIINELVGKLIVGPVVEQIEADFERTVAARQAGE